MNKERKLTTIIGLGNPGSHFDFTRHNAGFMIVEALADKYGGIWNKNDTMAQAQVVINGQKIMLVKPLTFMNLSGNIWPLLHKKGIRLENILVVHDELEKPFGAINFKEGGSHRGHNGLRSIIEKIGPEFLRLRFGIGRPEDKRLVSDYVVSRFVEGQQELALAISHAVKMIEDII